jgi:hypothetical protein
LICIQELPYFERCNFECDHIHDLYSVYCTDETFDQFGKLDQYSLAQLWTQFSNPTSIIHSSVNGGVFYFPNFEQFPTIVVHFGSESTISETVTLDDDGYFSEFRFTL